jgi:hypothetical protein
VTVKVSGQGSFWDVQKTTFFVELNVLLPQCKKKKANNSVHATAWRQLQWVNNSIGVPVTMNTYTVVFQ